MRGFTTTSTLAEMINKRPIRKRRRNVKKKKRRKVPKDKRSGLPKKYLAGLTGAKRSSRASLIKTMSRIYKSGGTIPAYMFRQRVK